MMLVAVRLPVPGRHRSKVATNLIEVTENGSMAGRPKQIANRLRIDFPDDKSMRISHEAIYQALYIQGRGALKRELVHCLRTGRALRVPRGRVQAKAWAHVSEDVMISSRPAEAQDRAVPGHWEGDFDHWLEPLCDRHAGRAIKPVHNARAPASRERLWTDSPNEERPRTGRLWGRDHGRCA